MEGTCEQDNKASDTINGMKHLILTSRVAITSAESIPLQGVGYGVSSNVHKAG